jgi:predicted nucleic acid-binding protein
VRFIDTNVVLYAVSRASGERSKAERANEILNARDVALSAQVLQEFYTQATRDSRQDRLTHEQAAGVVQTLGLFPTQDTTVALVLAAMEAKQRFGISYWDAAIIEAARGLGCAVVLSEDLSDGQDYAGVIVENPFSDL